MKREYPGESTDALCAYDRYYAVAVLIKTAAVVFISQGVAITLSNVIAVFGESIVAVVTSATAPQEMFARGVAHGRLLRMLREAFTSLESGAAVVSTASAALAAAHIVLVPLFKYIIGLLQQCAGMTLRQVGYFLDDVKIARDLRMQFSTALSSISGAKILPASAAADAEVNFPYDIGKDITVQGLQKILIRAGKNPGPANKAGLIRLAKQIDRPVVKLSDLTKNKRTAAAL